MLPDGNRGGKPFDGIHVRLIHDVHKTPGVGTHAFGITPLPFGVQGIKSKGTLPGTGQTGNHSKAVAGNIRVHVFQVMGAGTPNTDPIVGHDASFAAAKVVPAVR